jgi:hypothetical protein
VTACAVDEGQQTLNQTTAKSEQLRWTTEYSGPDDEKAEKSGD